MQYFLVVLLFPVEQGLRRKFPIRDGRLGLLFARLILFPGHYGPAVGGIHVVLIFISLVSLRRAAKAMIPKSARAPVVGESLVAP